MIKISIQRCATLGRDSIRALWSSTLKGLRTGQILGVLQLASVRAQVPVADVEQQLELAKADLVAHGKRAHDAKTHALIDQPIERGIVGLGAESGRNCKPGTTPRPRRLRGTRLRFSRHASPAPRGRRQTTNADRR